MKSSLTTFINDELLPRVIDNMDTVFPERKWTKKGYRWNSPYHTDGTESKSGKSVRSFLDTSKNHLNRVGESDGGGTVGLVGYAMMYKGYSPDAKGEPFISTIKYLCEKVGIEFPSHNSEEYEKYLVHQKKIEALYEEMRQALYTEEGRPTLEYLTNVRGYSLDEIKEMGFGHITKEMAERINNEKIPLSYNPNVNSEIESGKKKSLCFGIGITHTLVVPYISSNTIKGFKFRHLKKVLLKENKEVSKYFNNTGLPKGTSLFGFHGLQMTGNREKDRDLTIVEGELDCLHAQVMGMKNIVAVAGSSLDVAALQKVKAKGVVRITLLFDTEETPDKQKENYSKVEKAIKVIREVGITPFVASLPSNTGKMDVDEFLKDHTVAELSRVIDNAIPASLFLYNMVFSAAAENLNEDGTITYKNLDEFKRQTILLANSEYTSPTERQLIFKEFESSTNENISKETIAEEADTEYKKRVVKESQEKAERLTAGFLSSIKKEGIANVTSVAEDYISGIQDAVNAVNSDVDILAEDSDELFESFKEEMKAIETDLVLEDNYGHKYRFLMPSGALTVIGAPTNHGKSKLLQHFALNEAQKEEDGIVVYLSYEESVKSVTRQMINAFVDLELTRETAQYNNLTTITEYLQNGSTQYMKRDLVGEFQRKLSVFRSLLQKRKLKVVSLDDNYLSTLKRELNKIFSRRDVNVKAVYIDYIQELYIESNKNMRTDELKEIMVEIDRIAQKYEKPIILAAQLNRDTADGPLTLSNQCIADSGWIERKASEILLMWSNKEVCKKDPDRKKTDHANEKILGLNLGSGGKLYVTLTKSRYIPTGTSALLNIHGNSGAVEGNYKSPAPVQTQMDFDEDKSFF